VSTNIVAPLGEEYVLTGGKSGVVAYVGVIPDQTSAFSFSDGEVVLIRGVVVATGVTQQPGGSPQKAVYVIGLNSMNAQEEKETETLVKEAKEGS
jgi:hypothetical protein